MVLVTVELQESSNPARTHNFCGDAHEIIFTTNLCSADIKREALSYLRKYMVKLLVRKSKSP